MTARLWSIEWPMETAVTPPQVFVLATNKNGEFSCAPSAGVVTVIAAAGTHAPSIANIAEIEVFIDFHLLESDCYVPPGRDLLPSPTTPRT
jgi:hypothetical protein